MATAHITYVASKDRTAQIAVAMTDELHRLCWGRLHTANRPHDGLPIIEAEAMTWIRNERVKRPVVRPVDWSSPYADSSTIRSEAA